jgi:hypothetical protein
VSTYFINVNLIIYILISEKDLTNLFFFLLTKRDTCVRCWSSLRIVSWNFFRKGRFLPTLLEVLENLLEKYFCEKICWLKFLCWVMNTYCCVNWTWQIENVELWKWFKKYVFNHFYNFTVPYFFTILLLILS